MLTWKNAKTRRQSSLFQQRRGERSMSVYLGLHITRNRLTSRDRVAADVVDDVDVELPGAEFARAPQPLPAVDRLGRHALEERGRVVDGGQQLLEAALLLGVAAEVPRGRRARQPLHRLPHRVADDEHLRPQREHVLVDARPQVLGDGRAGRPGVLASLRQDRLGRC